MNNQNDLNGIGLDPSVLGTVSNEPPINPLESQNLEQNLSNNLNELPNEQINNQIQNNVAVDNLNDPAVKTEDNIETLGTIVMDQVKPENPGEVPPSKKEKKPMNKILFVIIILVLIAGIGYGVYYYLNISSKSVNMLNPSFNIDSTISTNISDYASFNGINANNCVLNSTKIDTSSEGEYTYSITCGTKTYEGIAIVKDLTAPVLTLTSVTKSINETISISDFVTSCIDSSKCTYEFKDEATVKNYLTKSGEYTIEIIAKDENGNEATETTTLTVIDGEVSAYLICNTSTTLTSYQASVMIIDNLSFDNSNMYLGIATRTYKNYITNKEDYEKIKVEYNGKTTFENQNGEITFDDEKMIVKVVSKLTSETLTKEYGSTFPTDYTSIKTYYSAKGYSCNSVNK